MNGTGRRVTRRQHVSEEKRAQARRFRTSPTLAEKRVWNLLRGRGLLGLKFRRQQVVAGFIVDFYCAELGLAIELDGQGHLEPQQATYDRERDAVLSRLGVRVIRVPNDLATRESLEILIGPYLILPPLPSGRGGQGVR
jgi:very-short-patch-repair endonuclease